MLTFSKKSECPTRTERTGAQKLANRARAYVEKMPAAISGQRGHAATFAVAVALTYGFNLPESDTWPILCDFNARCEPPWSEAELRHKLTSAGKLSRHPKPRGHLRGSDNQSKYLPIPEKPKRTVWEVKLEPLPVKNTAPLLLDQTAANENEAARIADELMKLHADGAVTGPDDPNAGVFAAVLHTFGATYHGGPTNNHHHTITGLYRHEPLVPSSGGASSAPARL